LFVVEVITLELLRLGGGLVRLLLLHLLFVDVLVVVQEGSHGHCLG
jgi:hypothetical protein